MASGGRAVSYRETLGNRTVAISISESPDMPALGLTEAHLRDGMAEIARHLLALGASLLYGGDLRRGGFSRLMFELVARHRRDADEGDERPGVVNFLAWPVHIQQPSVELEEAMGDLEGFAELVLLGLDGTPLSMSARQAVEQRQPTEVEWSDGLTAMRRRMLGEGNARVVLGGRVEGYKGAMPGIAEEALLSLQASRPLYLLGGFGGCAYDVAEALGLVAASVIPRRHWHGRSEIERFSPDDLNNGLSRDENQTLARTPHVDQAVVLILRGLARLGRNDSRLSGRNDGVP